MEEVYAYKSSSTCSSLVSLPERLAFTAFIVGEREFIGCICMQDTIRSSEVDFFVLVLIDAVLSQHLQQRKRGKYCSFLSSFSSSSWWWWSMAFKIVLGVGDVERIHYTRRIK